MSRDSQAVRWTGWDGHGLEHCLLRAAPEGLTLEGIVAGNRQGLYGAHYRVRTDAQGRTREVRVRYAGGPDLHVTAEEDACWRCDLRDEALPDLTGCIDIDIGVTPAPNTLPIRRLGLAVGQSADIRAAYVPLPSQVAGAFLPRPADQRYTRLDARLYRYEGLFRGFTADLPVDDLGLVIDYPTLFRRQVALSDPDGRA